MKIIFDTVGFACIAFASIGFFETILSLLKEDKYNLLRAIIYASTFGIGVALLRV